MADQNSIPNSKRAVDPKSGEKKKRLADALRRNLVKRKDKKSNDPQM
jgi:hypothetical protein